MQRILEREVMDEPGNAEAYAQADRLFEPFHRAYVADVLLRYGEFCQHVLDIGCGTALVPILLAEAVPHAQLTGLDASAPMLAIAQASIDERHVADRVRLVHQQLPNVQVEPATLVISHGLLHHLPDAGALWSVLGQVTARPAAVYIKDLIRPDTPEAAYATVEALTPNESPVYKLDFVNSLLAAHTVAEVTAQLAAHDLALTVEQVSPMHFLVHGVLR